MATSVTAAVTLGQAASNRVRSMKKREGHGDFAATAGFADMAGLADIAGLAGFAARCGDRPKLGPTCSMTCSKRVRDERRTGRGWRSPLSPPN
jgi:hypothetical protein